MTDQKELTSLEIAEVSGGSIVGWLIREAVAAAAEALRDLAGPNV